MYKAFPSADDVCAAWLRVLGVKLELPVSGQFEIGWFRRLVFGGGSVEAAEQSFAFCAVYLRY